MTGGEGEGVKPSLRAEDLCASVPQLSDLADIEATSLFNEPSPNLTMQHLFELKNAALEAFQSGADGVVVTQGTDTMEETSFAMDLLMPTGHKVIFTAAMRNPTQAGADGPANLLAAVQVAISDAIQNAGVLVVMNDEVHAPRHVKKSHTSSLQAFQSPAVGPVARISEGRVIPMAHHQPTPSFMVPDGAAFPNIPMIEMVFDDQLTLLDHLCENTIDGLVIAAFGGGRVPAKIVEKLDQLNIKIPVLITTRTGGGFLSTKTYGYPGGEMDLRSRGLLASSWQPRKARILLAFALMEGKNRDQIKRMFDE